MESKKATTMMDHPEKWPVIGDRISYIKQLADGLEVLDVGCTGKKADGRIPNPSATLHHSIEPVELQSEPLTQPHAHLLRQCFRR